MEHFKINQAPVPGIIEDTRDNGCGYDFKIKDGKIISEEFFKTIYGLCKKIHDL